MSAQPQHPVAEELPPPVGGSHPDLHSLRNKQPNFVTPSEARKSLFNYESGTERFLGVARVGMTKL